MTSGKGDGLSSDERKWALEHVPAFLAKTGVQKAVRGKTIPKDDKDLRAFVVDLRGKFMAQFSESTRRKIADGMTEARIERQFDDFFRNRKAEAIKKWNASVAQDAPSASSSSPSFTMTSTSTVSNPPSTFDASSQIAQLWSSVFQKAPITGRALFEKENRTAINAEVNASRQSESISHHQHVAMLKSKIKEQWDALGEDQEIWNDRAARLSDSDVEEKEQRSRNQAIFDLSIGAVLRHLIGPIKDGSHKIGHARFHVLYGYRDEEDELCTGFIDVPDDVMRAPFDAFVDDYKTKFIAPWHECCKVTVLENKPKPLPSPSVRISFVRDDDGCPIFPSVCEDTTPPESLRLLLTEFIQAQWDWTVAQNVPDMETIPPIPWLDPSFSSTLVDPTFELVDPASVKPPALYGLLSNFDLRQRATSRFQLFKFSKPAPVIPTETQASTESTDSHGIPTVTIASTSSTTSQDATEFRPNAICTSPPPGPATPLPANSTSSSNPSGMATQQPLQRLAGAESSSFSIPPPTPELPPSVTRVQKLPPLVPGTDTASPPTRSSSSMTSIPTKPTNASDVESSEPASNPPQPAGEEVAPGKKTTTKKKDKKSKCTPVVNPIPVTNASASSEGNPQEVKKSRKRKADATADGLETTKRVKCASAAAPARRSARQLQAESSVLSSKPMSTLPPVPDGLLLKNGKPATSGKNYYYAIVPADAQ